MPQKKRSDYFKRHAEDGKGGQSYFARHQQSYASTEDRHREVGALIPAALDRAQKRAKAAGIFTEGRLVANELANQLSDEELARVDILSAEKDAPAGLAGTSNRSFQPEDLEREKKKRHILKKAKKLSQIE